MKKVYLMGPFFLPVAAKNELYFMRVNLKTLGTPPNQSLKKYFLTPPAPAKKKNLKKYVPMMISPLIDKALYPFVNKII